MFKLFASYVVDRLKEPSTWNGLTISTAGILHVALSNGVANSIVGAGVAFGGLIGVVLKERGAI